MKIVFATNNFNKKVEIQSMLPPNFEIVNLEDIGFLDEIPENEPTISENAIQKANFITQKFSLDCFADDTGLEVEALNGEPGVFSARYAGIQRNSEDNINLLLSNLSNQKNRKARFKTVICLNYQGQQHLFEGIVNGTITKERAGNEGFGYDPVFIPDGYTETFAQLPLSVKNKISHRGIATQKLIDFLSNF